MSVGSRVLVPLGILALVCAAAAFGSGSHSHKDEEGCGSTEGMRAPSPTVDVVVKAPWELPPPMHEAAEFCWDESPDLFWKFLVVASGGHEKEDPTSSETDYWQHVYIRRVTNKLLSPLVRRTLSLYLSTHYYAPRLESMRRVAERELDAYRDMWSHHAFAVFRGKAYEDVDELEKAIQDAYAGDSAEASEPKEEAPKDEFEERLSKVFKKEVESRVYAFDHVFPTPAPLDPHHNVILYALIGSHELDPFHQKLAALAKRGLVRYVFRPFVPTNALKCRHESIRQVGFTFINMGKFFIAPQMPQIDRHQLEGYGVRLKVTDFSNYKPTLSPTIDDDLEKNVDEFVFSNIYVRKTESISDESKTDRRSMAVGGFDFNVLLDRYQDIQAPITEFWEQMIIEQGHLDFDGKVKVWELKDLGYQASQLILSSDDPLRVLQEMSQNFPSFTGIKRLKVDEHTRESIDFNARYFIAGRNVIMINGREVDPVKTSLYQLMEIIRYEVQLMDSITTRHFTPRVIRNWLTAPTIPFTRKPRLDLRSDAVIWLNNLETDERYAHWLGIPSFIPQAERGMGIPFIKKNMYNAVLFANLRTQHSIDSTIAMIRHWRMNAPVRIGLVLVTTEQRQYDEAKPEDDGEMPTHIARIFHHLSHHLSPEAGFAFLEHLLMSENGQPFSPKDMSDEHLEKVLRHVHSSHAHVVDQGKSFEDWFKDMVESHEYDSGIQRANEFYTSSGLPVLPCLTINGWLYDHYTADRMTESSVFVDIIREHVPYLVEMVRTQAIQEDTDVYEAVMSEDYVFDRYHPLVFEASKDVTILPLYRPEYHNIVNDRKYFYRTEPGDPDYKVSTVTWWLAADVGSGKGVQMVLEAFHWLQASALTSRVSLIHCGHMDTEKNYMHNADEYIKDYKDLLEPVLEDSKEEAWLKWFKNDLRDIENDKNKLVRDFAFCRDMLKLKPEEQAVVVNGQVVVVPGSTRFAEDTFVLMEMYEMRRRMTEMNRELDQLQDKFADEDPVELTYIEDEVLAAITRLDLELLEGKVVRHAVPSQPRKDGSFVVTREAQGRGALEVTCVLDPLSEVAQKWSSLLLEIEEHYPSHIRVFMNPQPDVSEFPLQNYYRYVFTPQLLFDNNGCILRGGGASFTNLPHQHTLEMTIDHPKSWVLTHTSKDHDLDNINLADSGSVIYSEFELTGHVVEGVVKQPENEPGVVVEAQCKTALIEPTQRTVGMRMPSGAGTDNNEYRYFQLILPRMGFWHIFPRRNDDQLTPLGHFTSTSHPMVDPSHFLLAQYDLEPYWLEYNHYHLSDESEHQHDRGLLEAFFTQMQDNRVHIYTVARGVEDEEMLRVMMISVVKHSKANVKFWILGNFASAKFKIFVRRAAANLGFQFEFLYFKWPTWMHQESEERQVQGFRVLFWDVMFPPDVERVLYLAPDMVFKGDVDDLYKMDLQGHVMARPRFGEGNDETENLRFWKQGFWAYHMSGRPYLSESAILIDMKKFRENGSMLPDNLRSEYQRLMGEANSLEDIARDLLNYAWHLVPTIPMDKKWFFCSTWDANDDQFSALAIKVCDPSGENKLKKIEQAEKSIDDLNTYIMQISDIEKVQSFENPFSRPSCCDHARKIMKNMFKGRLTGSGHSH